MNLKWIRGHLIKEKQSRFTAKSFESCCNHSGETQLFTEFWLLRNRSASSSVRTCLGISLDFLKYQKQYCNNKFPLRSEKEAWAHPLFKKDTYYNL